MTKILAGRPKDLDDVQGIVSAQAVALDVARIRDLLSALEAAIDRPDLLPCFEAQLHAARKRQ